MSPQQTIAHYRITSKLGEGGMGEVWRATDTKLNREVAIKILPEAFAADSDRLARFTREAQVLASLNHPNIAAIYGVENRALVMELVEGEDLHGPVPVETAIAYSRQIVAALEAAHERGIVHRDLKPANIKVTPEGVVKLLDFGLAKAPDPAPSAPAVAGPTISPTLSLAMTQAGMLLGTAAYMAPEQARGKPVDKRADIWAFGVVLYELLTGKMLFGGGESATDVIAAVVTREPDWSALPQDTPPYLRRLLERGLVKDPKLRLRDIGEARIALETSPAAEQASAAPPSAQPATRRGAPWWLSAVALSLSLALGVFLFRATRPTERPLLRFTDDLGMELSHADVSHSASLSPDGTRVAFISADRRLFVRSLDDPKPVALAGTDGDQRPFFSPDGAWIAFFSLGQIRKVAVQGGAPIALCEAQNMIGASWGEDGYIVFAPNNRSGLFRVSQSGGKPEPVTQLDAAKGEITHRFPQVLPGGRAVLFTTGTPGNYEDASIEAQVLKTGERKVIYRGGYYGRYLPSGHLVYMHDGTLFAAPMNLVRLALTGPPAPILSDVRAAPSAAAAAFDFSQTGTLAYVPAVNSQTLSLAWVDAGGKAEPMSAPPKRYLLPMAMSPDGTRLAVAIQDGAMRNLWVYDWRRDRLFPVTFGNAIVTSVAWSADGQHLAYGANVQGGPIYWVRSDGAGQPEHLLEATSNAMNGLSLSSDGKRLAFSFPSGIKIATLDLSDPEHPKAGQPELFPTRPGRPANVAFSPDGRWLAYASDESGHSDVYVASLAAAGGKWLVSNNGGAYPVWARNGKELFYQSNAGRLMVLTYTTRNDSFEADHAHVWVDRAFPTGNNALAADGSRFAVAVTAGDLAPKPATHLVFLLNFFDELKRRVPVQ